MKKTAIHPVRVGLEMYSHLYSREQIVSVQILSKLQIVRSYKMVKVIMLSGLKRSGKDFMASKLKDMFEDSKIMSLAEPLKDIIAITMGINLIDLDRFKNESTKLYTDEGVEVSNFRSILQRFGNEAMKKHFGGDVWSELFLSKLPKSGVVIIPDWRFIVEYEGLLCKVGIENITTIRIVNHNLKSDGHTSESGLDEFAFDYYLDNTQQDNSYDDYLNKIVEHEKL